MKANKVLAMTLAMAMTAGMLAGCGSSEKEVKETKKVEDSASEGEQITLNYCSFALTGCSREKMDSIIRHRLLHLRTHLKMMKDTPAA